MNGKHGRAQKKQESKIKTYMVHREYIDNLQAGGMQVQNPIPKGVPQPGRPCLILQPSP